MKRTEQMEEWAENHPEVKLWLGKIQAKEGGAFDFYRFCEWSGKSPSELLALKDDPGSKDAERLLDTFVADEKAGFKNSAKYRIVIAVKSFFKHNYKDLARACGAITLEKVKPYNKPRKEDLRKLWSLAFNPRDRALITFVNSTAIAKETLANLKWEHLEENWQDVELPCINIPSKFLKGHGRGKYRDVRQITFLTPEAKRDLINYKEWMEEKMERELTGDDNIWLETCYPYEATKYANLGTIILKMTKRTHVKFSWHDARRYVNTTMEEIRMPSNWARKIRGRKVKGEENPYSLPAIQQLREKFQEAVPLLEFTSEKPSVSGEIVERLKIIEDVMAGLTREEKEMAKIRIAKMRKRKAKRGKGKEEKTKTNGGWGKQKVVSEAELGEYLQQGWRVITALPSGNVVVER